MSDSDEQLSLIPLKRPPGRPPGIPKKGSYGLGIQTIPYRVPVGSEEFVRSACLDRDFVEWCFENRSFLESASSLPSLIRRWETEAKASKSPRYGKLRIFLSELKQLFSESNL